jgi:pimeloyl-ACP methyl ester carboxylesterase
MTKHTTTPRGNIAWRTRNGEASGAPIVFIHGAGGRKESWIFLSHVLAGLLPTRPLVMIDLPGHGESPPPGREIIDDYAQDVLAFLQAEGWSSVDLVGHSMGGVISQCLAINSPTQFRRLALVATGARLKVVPVLFDLLPNQPELAFGAIRQFGFGQDAKPEIVEATIQLMLAGDPVVAYHDFKACACWDGVDRLAHITAPTLVVAGDEDKLTPARWNEALAAGITGAKYVLLPRTGHMIPLEREQELAQLLADHLGD